MKYLAYLIIIAILLIALKNMHSTSNPQNRKKKEDDYKKWRDKDEELEDYDYMDRLWGKK